MAKRTRKSKHTEAAVRPPADAPGGNETPGSAPPQEPTPALLSPHNVLLLGGALLALLVLFDLPADGRSPGSLRIVIDLGAACGLAVVAAFFFRRELGSSLSALALGGGTLMLLSAMGIAPELLALPTSGIGDRLWGFPTLVGLPLAGAALVRCRSKAGLLLAASAVTLTLVGLFQPTDLDAVVRPAVLHHLSTLASGSALRTASIVALLLGVALGLSAVWVRGQRPESALPRIAGALLLGALPLWELLRLVQIVRSDLPTSLPAAGLAFALATSMLLWAGLPSAVDDPPPWTHRFLPRTAEGLTVFGVAALFVLLKAFTWRWSSTDENIYFYDAWLWAQGAVPYRDFFFAHPPLHIAVPALIFKIFGFDITIAKLIPTGAALATGLMLWAMLRDRIGWLGAVTTLGAFLFAFELLQASTNMNGVNLTSFWVTASLFAFVRRKHVLSGALAGLAVTTGFYAAAAAAGLALLAFFGSPRDGLKQTLALVGVAGAINLIFWLLAGDTYLEAVYQYHVLKHPKPTQGVFLKMLYYHAHLGMGVLLAPVAVAWQHFRGVRLVGMPADPEPAGSWFAPGRVLTERSTGVVRLCWLVFVGLLVEFTLFSELYDFYFALLIPTAAVCTGYVVALVVAAFRRELGDLISGRLTPAMAAPVALAVLFSLWVPLARETNWAFSSQGPTRVLLELQLPPEIAKGLRPELARTIPGALRRRMTRQQLGRKIQDGRWLFAPPGKPAQGSNSEFIQRGDERHYRWVEPSHLKSIAGPVIRALFWRDHRTKWTLEPGYRHFLWQKSLHISVLSEVAAAVRERSTEDETVLGNSLTAPAVALAAQRRIAGGFVDTNAKRFHTGLTTLQDLFEAACQDRIRFLVSSPSGYINDALLSRLPVVRKYFRKAGHFRDPWNKFLRRGEPWWGITLWELAEPPGSDGPRCHWICRDAADCKDEQRCERGRCVPESEPQVTWPPRPANGSPIGTQFVRMIGSGKRLGAEVRLFNHTDRDVTSLRVGLRYLNASGAQIGRFSHTMEGRPFMGASAPHLIRVGGMVPAETARIETDVREVVLVGGVRWAPQGLRTE